MSSNQRLVKQKKMRRHWVAACRELASFHRVIRSLATFLIFIAVGASIVFFSLLTLAQDATGKKTAFSENRENACHQLKSPDIDSEALGADESALLKPVGLKARVLYAVGGRFDKLSIQSKIDESYDRVLNSALGKTIVTKIFSCKAEDLKFHLGMSSSAAERISRAACIDARPGQKFKFIAAEPRALMPGRNQDLVAPERMNPRCLEFYFAPKASQAEDSFTINDETVFNFDPEDPDTFSPDRIDRMIAHEIGIILDAKAYMNYPDFFIANGYSPSAFSNAPVASIILSHPILHEVWSRTRAFLVENSLLGRPIDTPFSEDQDLAQVFKANRDVKHFETMQSECVRTLNEQAQAAIDTYPSKFWWQQKNIFFNGARSFLDYKPPFNSFMGTSIRERIGSDLNYSLKRLQLSYVIIDDTLVPLCLWMKIPSLSGRNSYHNEGPRPRLDGD